MNTNRPEPCDRRAFTFTAAAGNTVIVTDQWVEEGSALSTAVVIDRVTDERFRVVLVETDETETPTMRWLRRIHESYYIETDIYAVMEFVPHDDEEFADEFAETIGNAEMELVMAVGLSPRHDLEAQWLGRSQREYICTLQSQVDDAAPEDVEMKRQGLFGVSTLF